MIEKDLKVLVKSGSGNRKSIRDGYVPITKWFSGFQSRPLINKPVLW